MPKHVRDQGEVDSGVQAEPEPDGVRLTWSFAGAGKLPVSVERADSSAGAWTVLGSILSRPGSGMFLDPTAQDGFVYRYRLRFPGPDGFPLTGSAVADTSAFRL